MAHALTSEEHGLLQVCVQSDPVRSRLGIHSRLGALEVLKGCIFYTGREEGMHGTMRSLMEKLFAMSDAEFTDMDLDGTCGKARWRRT